MGIYQFVAGPFEWTGRPSGFQGFRRIVSGHPFGHGLGTQGDHMKPFLRMQRDANLDAPQGGRPAEGPSFGARPRGKTSCCMKPSMNWNRFRRVTSLTPATFAIAFCGRRSPHAREAR